MNHTSLHTPLGRLAAALLVGGVLTAPARPAAAQGLDLALAAPTAAEGGAATTRSSAGSALERGRYAVVIDLDQNRLFFKRGDLTLWSAPVGTGTGLRLKADDAEWKFSTPNGVFHVQYKEQNPVWNAPDWYFVENGLPVPPEGDPKRRFPGGLGAAALFIEHDLAIHGTNRPELLGQRVSHGCIRLSNRDALRLYHNVQVGTEVVIVGGEDVPEKVVTPAVMMAQRAKATFDPARPAPKDPALEGWKALGTPELLQVLSNELWLPPESSRWPEVAAILLERGVEGDDEKALPGLMARVERLPDTKVEREYATFLAHAFGRSPHRALAALASLERDGQRTRAARAIVEATMHLYHGAFDEPGAPWPTSRLPRDLVAADSESAWELLADAERDFRGLAIRD